MDPEPDAPWPGRVGDGAYFPARIKYAHTGQALSTPQVSAGLCARKVL